MDMSQKILAAILAGFFLVALLRVFSSPFRLALKLLLNTLLGFLALWAVRLTAGLTGIALGLNLWNALVIGVLGLPGFVLLLLVQWVLYGTYCGPGDRPPSFIALCLPRHRPRNTQCQTPLPDIRPPSARASFQQGTPLPFPGLLW